MHARTRIHMFYGSGTRPHAGRLDCRPAMDKLPLEAARETPISVTPSVTFSPSSCHVQQMQALATLLHGQGWTTQIQSLALPKQVWLIRFFTATTVNHTKDASKTIPEVVDQAATDGILDIRLINWLTRANSCLCWLQFKW